MTKTLLAASAAALLLAGCGTETTENAAVETASATPQDAFLASIKEHCGKAYEGRVVTTDPADKDFASNRLVMHVRECTDDEVKIPFHVGEDRSRTWVITRTETGLRLKHDHRHEDGTDDAVTMYGGDTDEAGTASLQSFPVDQYSIDMFHKNDLPQSVTNVWQVEVTPETYAYVLRRENRNLRVEFDLTNPVEAPPAPWGHS